MNDLELILKGRKLANKVKFLVSRNVDIDGRNGCGMGYSVDMIDRNGDKKIFRFRFNQSKAGGSKRPTKKDLLYGVITDYSAFDQTQTHEEFCDTFGYVKQLVGFGCDTKEDIESYNQGWNAYEGCKNCYEKLSYLWDEDDVEAIYEYLREQGY